MDEEELAKLLARPLSAGGSVSAGGASFTPLTFDWLGRLPAVMQAAQQQQTREQTLAELKPGTNLLDPTSANDLAAKLFARGDFTGGNKILAAAQKAKELENARLSADALSAFIKKYGSTGIGIQPTAGSTTVEEPVPQLPAAVQPTPAAPAAAPAPQYPWPTSVPGQVAPTPGPQGAVTPSSSDELIARAQAGLAGGSEASPMVQLAQAGGGLPPVGGAPSTGLPDWMTGAQQAAPPVPSAPPAPPAPPAPSQETSGRPTTPLNLPRLTVSPGADKTAIQELQQINQQILAAALASKASPLLSGALQQQLRSVLARLYPDQKRRDYEFQMYQRAVQGEPVVGMETWDRENKLSGATYDEARAEAKKYIVDTEKSRGLIQNMEIAKSIMSNPAFASGGAVGGAAWDKLQGTLIGIRDYARSQGVSEDNLPSLDSMRTTAGLQQAFKGLMNSSLLYKVTSFGPGFSNIDLQATQAIFPSLGDTPEANRLKADLMIASEKNKLAINRIVNGYMERKKTDASAYELNRLVDDYTRTHSPITNEDGTPTELGKRLMEFVAGPGKRPQSIKDYIKQDIIPPSMLPAARDLYNRITTPPPKPSESTTRGPYPPEDEGRMGTDLSTGERYIIRNGHPEILRPGGPGYEQNRAPTQITVPIQPGRG